MNIVCPLLNFYRNFLFLKLSCNFGRILIRIKNIYSSVMQIKEGLEIRNIAGERVLIMQGRYGVDMTRVVSFNETAEWLWNQLHDKVFSQEDVVRLLAERFQVDTETAEIDAKKWIEQLIQCKAIE